MYGDFKLNKNFSVLVYMAYFIAVKVNFIFGSKRTYIEVKGCD